MKAEVLDFGFLHLSIDSVIRKNMNAYVKGAIGAAVILSAVFLWYRANVNGLIVNRPPAGYALLTSMEKNGVPDFRLEKLDGTSFKLSEHEGKITIINFWASWCNPCVEEFPSMIKLVDHFGDKLQIIAVSTDDDKKDIANFLKAFGLPKPGFEVVWDKNKEAMKQFGIEKVPESFLVDKDGKLIRKVLGIENWSNDNALGYFQSLLDGTTDLSKIPGHGGSSSAGAATGAGGGAHDRGEARSATKDSASKDAASGKVTNSQIPTH